MPFAASPPPNDFAVDGGHEDHPVEPGLHEHRKKYDEDEDFHGFRVGLRSAANAMSRRGNNIDAEPDIGLCPSAFIVGNIIQIDVVVTAIALDMLVQIDDLTSFQFTIAHSVFPLHVCDVSACASSAFRLPFSRP
jgi:hypothetical protein